ncbi:MAG: TlpA family protein disulfide reductase [Proteobacteria bacterium]|nr:TlpA family protein disulfide reductase [Pseudomonadota bacterium]
MPGDKPPAWQVREWLNADDPPSLQSLRGKVVLLEAFQMLCPGCVSHGIPQALRARQTFPEDALAVLGLHTVFEHHAAQGSAIALKAFLHENRVHFPVGIDAHAEGEAIPLTMRAYAMQGTPTLLLYDRKGRLRMQRFGMIEDMQLGAEIATLIGEAAE